MITFLWQEKLIFTAEKNCLSTLFHVYDERTQLSKFCFRAFRHYFFVIRPVIYLLTYLFINIYNISIFVFTKETHESLTKSANIMFHGLTIVSVTSSIFFFEIENTNTSIIIT